MQNARGSAEAIRSATEALVDDAVGSGRESAVQVAVILNGDTWST